MADTSNQKLFQLAKKGDIKALSKIASHSDLNSRDAYQQTALHIAAYEGHFQAVNLLLALGADPNARDKNEWTPLHSAASGDRTENHLICMEMILRKGGDPNAVTNSQASVLHYLVRCPYSEKLMSLLQLLVDKGGNIDPREEYGETPLHQACFRGASQTVQFLIKHGAGLDNLNAIGEAPLHMAARAGKKDVVLMLLSNDADPYLEGPNGDPREVAFVSNQSEIVDLFDEQERMLDAVDAMMRGHGTADDSDGEDELDAVAAVESVSKELSLSGGMDANALFGLQYVEEDLSSSTSSLDLSATPRGGGGAKKVGGLMKKMGSKATLLETAPGSPKRDSSPKLSRKGTMMLAEKLKQRRRPDARKSEKRFIQSHPGFNLELGSRSLETSSKASDISLEYTDEHDDYYFVMHFVKDPKGCFRGASAKCHLEEVDFIKHMNFVGTLDSMQCVFSVRLEPEGGNYRCIVKTPVKDTTFWLYPAEVKKLLPKYIIKAIEVRFPGTSDLVLVEDVQLSRGLVELDLILKIQKYKFGVVYCKPDQTEEEMFNNTDTSPEFEDFLNCIAQRVDLEGWTNYRGDLDVKRRFCWIASFHLSTGKESYYRKWRHLEVMLEVAPMIVDCRRKPIIGNTITTIIFQDGGVFDPSKIVSQVLHVFCVVQPIKDANGKTLYKVGTATKKGVPRFRPSLPFPSIFELGDAFRDFLFTKLINGERASYHCSTKVRRQNRSLVEIVQHTRSGQLEYQLGRAAIPVTKKKKR